ncbi:vWA domain-containing protein [Candidatus Nanohalovita haloferacivicina]|uniref:vWA domain-containing protein n=1 Tax=Candidatus Nanohalovita haloferacivicina TaxID=2978046 RepID=UPI00325F951B|nr:vWFA domain containing protein [Candidatus Nanohalobia archaeon BNXNv]
MKKGLLAFIVVLYLALASGANTYANDLSSSAVDVDGDGEFVMGREVVTSFNYTINNPYRPIDTAIVIDESGSMSGVIGSAKQGAKDYVDATNTSSGDRNAVVEFESDADILESLTTSKQDAKDAIDTINDGGGTDLPAGVSKGHSALTSASDPNPIQVMIVLADGGGGDPGTEADDARDDGIEVHGIMYGSGASTSEFESMTDSSDCSKNSNENSDGDSCWYAETGSITSVYEQIREQVDQDVQGELGVVLPDHAYVDSSYDSSTDLSGPNTRYKLTDIPTDDGEYKRSFSWYPTTKGYETIKTGESYLKLDVQGSTDYYNYTSSFDRDIKYVDFSIQDTNIEREETEINVNYTVANDGNIASRPRDLKIIDGEGHIISRNVDPIPAGGTFFDNFTVGANHNVFQDSNRITAFMDYLGFFNSIPPGEGGTLEPNENNNDQLMGYPPRLISTSPSTVEWNDTFRFSLDFGHYYADQVQGKYSVYENGTLIRDNVSFSKPAEGTVQTNDIDNDNSTIYYNITSYLEGPSGATAIYRDSYYVSNPRPEIYAAEPKNLNSVYESPVQLRAFVDDENNVENPNNLNVTVRDYETGRLLLSKKNVLPRSSVSYDWVSADQDGKTYRWNVTVEDRWHQVSEVFRFKKSTRFSYRTETESNYSYSGVVASSGGQGDFRFTVSNPLDFDKDDMQTSLSGVDAKFEGTGTNTKSYSLPNGTTRTFNIIVSPNSSQTGQQYLQITTTNQDLNINNTDNIPIYIRKDAKRSRGVPGLGMLQLMVLLASSALIFFRRI